jgi:hypothetical protein
MHRLQSGIPHLYHHQTVIKTQKSNLFNLVILVHAIVSACARMSECRLGRIQIERGRTGTRFDSLRRAGGQTAVSQLVDISPRHSPYQDRD